MRAILVESDDDGYRCSLSDVDEAMLPDGDVTVRVEYSTLNYKDSLAVTGASPVVRSFPMVPGVDLAGVVESTDTETFAVGDRVVLNGWGVGETRWGGYAELCRLRSEWLMPLNDAFTTRQAMAIGTAGYTAMLCVMALEDGGVTPSDGEVIVTGAGGGVGSIAVSLLASLGYTVLAATGRPELGPFLTELGATEIVDRSELSEPGRPLASERWAGAVDTVGSHTLANVCAATRYGGVVAACGLAQGFDLPTTVMPFILRGVRLQGVDSVHRPMVDRIAAWDRLARDLDMEDLDRLTTELDLDAVMDTAPKQLAGQIRGRMVIRVSP